MATAVKLVRLDPLTDEPAIRQAEQILETALRRGLRRLMESRADQGGRAEATS